MRTPYKSGKREGTYEIESWDDQRGGVYYIASVFDEKGNFLGYTHDSADRSAVIEQAKEIIRGELMKIDIEKIVTISLMCILAILFVLLVITAIDTISDRSGIAASICEDWGGWYIDYSQGSIFVRGDWSAICIDKNPDRIMFISGEDYK